MHFIDNVINVCNVLETCTLIQDSCFHFTVVVGMLSMSENYRLSRNVGIQEKSGELDNSVKL